MLLLSWTSVFKINKQTKNTLKKTSEKDFPKAIYDAVLYNIIIIIVN